MPVNVMWFKKDLRVRDNKPLFEAAQNGYCLCIYVYEPELIAAEDYDACHLAFTNQALLALGHEIQKRGGFLDVLVGSMPEVLNDIKQKYGLDCLYSHEETGNGLSYQRDIRVKKWCREHGVQWIEIPQFGVIRGLKDRNRWAAHWHKFMSASLLPIPHQITPPPANTSSGQHALEKSTLGLLDASFFKIDPSTKVQAQIGGEAIAEETFRSFLNARGMTYQRAMSSPNLAFDACSRISPYLTFGCISLKYVYQETQAHIQFLKTLSSTELPQDEKTAWLKSLYSFNKRLHWHCHFIQKLESEPEIEFENMNRAFDGLRDENLNEKYFDAWKQGQTGYPLIDVCMRCLHETGWINFRMRAMLASFASYHLWLHWQRPAQYLARQFLDYEPGIHYSQFQMQSGVTGINAIRIYSPTKQAIEQDPEGAFIRRYVPELASLPTDYIHSPETLPPLLALSYNVKVGVDYPLPIVNHDEAYKLAQKRIYEVKKSKEARQQSQLVYEKHGSRKRQAQ